MDAVIFNSFFRIGSKITLHFWLQKADFILKNVNLHLFTKIKPSNGKYFRNP